MKRINFYWLTFFVGIIMAVYVLYGARIINIVAAPSPSGAAQAAALFPSPEETQYIMRLYLEPGSRIIYGETRIITSNTSGQGLGELWFTAYPNAFNQSSATPAPADAYYAGFNPGWIEFEEISVNGQKAQYSSRGVSVQVLPPADIMPGSQIDISIKWKALVPRLAYRYGARDGVYMLGNFYPALNVLDEDGWHNSYNSVFGDPFCFHCANYLVELNIPENYDMVATGDAGPPIIEDNGRQTYVIKAENARDFSLVLMYDYTRLQTSINKINVNCYVPNGQGDFAQPVLDKAASMLNYFNCSLGTYPYKQFNIAFVPMKGFHGMEYSGMIFLSEDYLKGGGLDQSGEMVLAHEIAHQWWYGMVGNDQLKEPWMDEGLANWSAYKYLEDVEKVKVNITELKEGVSLARELRDMYSKQDYYLTAYSGGEAFWFGLEKELGKDEVNKVLRRYLATYRFKIAGTKDLLEVIKKEAHSNMDSYFYKWFKINPGG
ncbi:MAG: M1 family metallopeptidase [Syntrophomonas sp.]